MDDKAKTRYWSGEYRTRMKRICYRTIWAECDWRLLANKSEPESINIVPNDGYGSDMNSTGLYQQRKQWWGDVAGSMDPYISTMRFIDHTETNTPDWFARAKDAVGESDVCQRTQGSQFDGKTINPKTGKPYPYASNYLARSAQVDALEKDLHYFASSR